MNLEEKSSEQQGEMQKKPIIQAFVIKWKQTVFPEQALEKNLKSKKAEQRMVRASVLQAVSPEFPYCHTQAAIAGIRTA